MNVAEIKYINWDKKTFKIRFFDLDDRNGFDNKDLTDNNFQIFYDDIDGLINEFNGNNELLKKMYPFQLSHSGYIILHCLYSLYEYPQKIKDFNLFSNRVTDEYVKYYNYYRQLHSKDEAFGCDEGIVRYKTMMSATDKLREWLTDILKQED